MYIHEVCIRHSQIGLFSLLKQEWSYNPNDVPMQGNTLFVLSCMPAFRCNDHSHTAMEVQSAGGAHNMDVKIENMDVKVKINPPCKWPKISLLKA